MVKELKPGDPPQVGKYRLLGELGSGGMGRVFLARSPGGRQVAVKVIRPDLAGDPDFRARFAREVATARKVSGIFTAPVVDADLKAAQPWLVTAYVEGPSLDDAVTEQGPLPAAAVRTLAAGLAEGLGAIHAAGVVHRDLKPSNVLLARDGPRIIDFGISRAADGTALTRAGWITGSPGFMSPEQAEGGRAGPASDIFSLGAVLTFAATGQGAFGTGSPATLLYRVVHSAPETDQLPGSLRPLLERCLAKDPRQRPTTDQIIAALDTAAPAAGWLAQADLPLTRPERRRPSRGATFPDADLAPPSWPADAPTRAHPPPVEAAPVHPAPPGRPPADPAAGGPAAGSPADGPAASEQAPGWSQHGQPPAGPAPGWAEPGQAWPGSAAGWLADRPAPAGPARDWAERGRALAQSARDGWSQLRDLRTGRGPAPSPRSVQPLAWAGAALVLAVIGLAVLLGVHLLGGSSGARPGAHTGSAASGRSRPGGSPAQAAWARYQDPSGFSIRLPAAWRVRARTAEQVTFAGPAGFAVVVAWTTDPHGDQLADWRQQAAGRAASDPTYQQISIRRVAYRGYDAADWSFTNTSGGTVIHVLDRGFIVAPGQLAYAIELYGPQARWPAVYPRAWRELVRSFRPATS
jgi:serine/threonine protein kinase